MKDEVRDSATLLAAYDVVELDVEELKPGRETLDFILQGLRTQEAKGLEKYGATLDGFGGGAVALAQHLIEERLDALMYAVALSRLYPGNDMAHKIAVSAAVGLINTLHRLSFLGLGDYSRYPLAPLPRLGDGEPKEEDESAVPVAPSAGLLEEAGWAFEQWKSALPEWVMPAVAKATELGLVRDEWSVVAVEAESSGRQFLIVDGVWLSVAKGPGMLPPTFSVGVGMTHLEPNHHTEVMSLAHLGGVVYEAGDWELWTPTLKRSRRWVRNDGGEWVYMGEQ